MAESDHAGLVTRLDDDLVREAPDQQALEAALLRVPTGALLRWEIVAGGVGVVDEGEDLACVRAGAALEDILGIEAAMGLLLLGHARSVSGRRGWGEPCRDDPGPAAQGIPGRVARSDSV